MPADIATFLAEYEQLKAQAWAWQQDWQDIADLMMPGQSDILTWRQPGTSRTRHLYDSTALWALDTFVAHFGAWITNFQMQWFGLRMHALRDVREASAWLDDVARLQYEEMVSDVSSVPTAVHESYRQYGGMGTGCLYVDELPLDEVLPRNGFRGYEAHALPVNHYYPAENAAGRVDTLYRDVEMTPHQAAQRWGEDALHPDMRTALTEAQSKRRYQPCSFVQGVYPRRGRDPRRRDARNMAWASVWVDMKHKHIVSESGYPWFPFMVYRWEKLASHAPFGFGRGHLVLPEAKTLQLIDKDALRALPLSVLPPGWLVGESRETIGRVSLLPGAMNPLAKGGSFVPYTSGQRWDLAQLQIEERRNRILRAFFIDQLQFLPEPGQRTQRTLGELQLRQRQMARIMGPALMRLLAEFLNPFIDITFSLLLHAGAFPPPPQSIIDAAGANQGIINVEYLGPLARAQKDDEVEAILEGVDVLTRLAQTIQDPMVIQNIALDETIARYLRTRGFPESLITDRRVMQEIRAEAQRQLARQQQLTEAQQAASAAGDAAPALQAIEQLSNGGRTATA